MSKINNELTKSGELIMQINRLIADKIAAIDSRSQIVASYFDMAREHNEAVILLVRKQLYGSAAALIRPIIDCLFRALWVYGCASIEDVEKIRSSDNFPFPRNIDSIIDKKYKGDGFFSKIKGLWKTASSYTHPGLLAIGRRFTGSLIQPNYDEGELIEMVRISTTVTLMLLRLVLMINNLQSELRKSEEMMISYTLATEPQQS